MADNNDLIKFGAIILVAYLIFGQGAQTPPANGGGDNGGGNGGDNGGGNGGGIIDNQCAYAPTVQLGANDKYNSGQTNWGNWKYILNGGTATTDADGSFEVAKGDALSVLVADANSSIYFKAVWDMTITKCGTQPLAYNEVVAVDTGSVKCFNDINQPINGSTYSASYANYTVGTGGSVTSRCELTTTAKKGAPYGAIVILELNSTTWKENDLALQWNGVQATAFATPGAYKLGQSTGISKSFEIPAYGAQTSLVIPFYVTAQAESTIDPTAGFTSMTNYGNGISGYIIPKNCYEEEDVTPSNFKCAYEDIDGEFTAPGGTAKATAAIAQFNIPVQ